MKKSEELLEVERLEKEGKIKEMIPKWEKLAKELKTERDKHKFGTKEYFEIWDKLAPINDMLDWSHLTPEERERELEVKKSVNERLERKRKIEEAFEAKLTKRQMEIREKVIGILSTLVPKIVGCTITEEQMEKQGESDRAIYENAKKRLLGLLKEVGSNPEKIREVLSEQDCIGAFGFPALAMFDELYAECAKRG